MPSSALMLGLVAVLALPRAGLAQFTPAGDDASTIPVDSSCATCAKYLDAPRLRNWGNTLSRILICPRNFQLQFQILRN